MNEGVMFQAQKKHLGPRGSGFRFKDSRKGLWNLPLKLRNAAEARRMSGVFLRGGLRRRLCEAVKMTLIALEAPSCWRYRSCGTPTTEKWS